MRPVHDYRMKIGHEGSRILPLFENTEAAHWHPTGAAVLAESNEWHRRHPVSGAGQASLTYGIIDAWDLPPK